MMTVCAPLLGRKASMNAQSKTGHAVFIAPILTGVSILGARA